MRKLENHITREELRSLYHSEGMTSPQIGRRYGFHCSSVTTLMKKWAIPIRKYNRLQMYSIDENFFSSWSPNMAWVLGLLWTDGSFQEFRGGYIVSITSVDREMLDNIEGHLQSTYPIREPRSGTYCLSICNREICLSLKKLGLHPNKTFTIRFPDVPNEFLPHFFRGCIDGDGSIGVYRNGNRLNLAISFVSGSRCFIQSLAQKIESAVPLNAVHIRKDRNHRAFGLSHSDSLKLGGWMYYGSSENNRLDRKYRKYVEGTKIQPVWRRISKEFLCKEYIKAGRTATDIARSIGCCISTVLNAVDRHGLPRHSRKLT